MQGLESFTYTKDQCRQVHEYLKSNGGNIARAFACVWEEGIFESRNPVLVIEMIDRIDRWTRCYVDFDAAWDAMVPSGEWSKIVKRELPPEEQ